MADSASLPVNDVADTGHGAPVLFSHGTLLDRTMFLPQTGALSESYRAILVGCSETAGHGS